MSADDRVYLDTSALAKWYLDEPGSEVFAEYLQGVDVAIISRLTHTEMRSLLSRRRRMGELERRARIRPLCRVPGRHRPGLAAGSPCE
jgi:uncharacterized protein with PIN domain